MPPEIKKYPEGHSTLHQAPQHVDGYAPSDIVTMAKEAGVEISSDYAQRMAVHLKGWFDDLALGVGVQDAPHLPMREMNINEKKRSVWGEAQKLIREYRPDSC